MFMVAIRINNPTTQLTLLEEVSLEYWLYANPKQFVKTTQQQCGREEEVVFGVFWCLCWFLINFPFFQEDAAFPWMIASERGGPRRG